MTTLTASPPPAIAPAPTPTTAATTTEPSGGPATPSAGASSPSALAVDPALLGVLPARVGGVEMTPDPDSAAQLIGDPTLGTTASGIAVARYVRDDEIMVVSVVQLRPGVYSDGFFDTWRADYDTSACQPAGGVTGTETVQTLGSHEAHMGTCTGGATTFHTRLDGDILVSAIAVGAGSLGRDVIGGLRP